MKVISEKRVYFKPESEVVVKIDGAFGFMRHGTSQEMNDDPPGGGGDLVKGVTWDNEDDGFDW